MAANLVISGTQNEGTNASVSTTAPDDIIIQSGGTLDFQGNGGASSLTSGGGDLTVDSGGTLRHSGSDTLGITATISNSGTIQFTSGAGATTIGNSVNNNSVGSFDIQAGSGTVSIVGTVTNSGTFTNAGTAQISSALLNGGTFTNSGTTDVTGVFTTNAGMIQNSGTLNAQGTFTFNGGLFDNTGTFAGTGAVELFGGEFENNNTLTSNGLLRVDGGILDNNGTLNANAGMSFTSGTFDHTGVLNLTGDFTGSLTNNGTYSPGGDDTTATNAISGNFVQNSGGILYIDVGTTDGDADMLDIAGTATLAGTLTLNPLGVIAPTNEYVILEADGGISGTFDTVTQTAAITQEVEIAGNQVILQATADFEANAGNDNQASIGQALNAILGAGGGDVQPLITALAGVVDVGEYQADLDQLSPEIFLAEQTSSLFAAGAFTGTLLSCPQAGPGMPAAAEGNCVWAEADLDRHDRGATSQTIGISSDFGGIAGGFQSQIGGRWFAGVAFGYETGSIDADTGATSDLDRYHGGAVLKYVSGPALLAATVTVGSTSYSSVRVANVGALTTTNRSSHDMLDVTAQVRAAGLFEAGGVYLKPMVDLGATYLDRDGFSETGDAATALTVAGVSETYLFASPALEIGATTQIADTISLRTFTRAGATFFADDEMVSNAAFSGAPSGTGQFSVAAPLDDVYANVEAGMILSAGDSRTLEFSYRGVFSSGSSQNGGAVKATIGF